MEFVGNLKLTNSSAKFMNEHILTKYPDAFFRFETTNKNQVYAIVIGYGYALALTCKPGIRQLKISEIGFASLDEYENNIHIPEIFVFEEFRGLNIGSKLIEAISCYGHVNNLNTTSLKMVSTYSYDQTQSLVVNNINSYNHLKDLIQAGVKVKNKTAQFYSKNGFTIDRTKKSTPIFTPLIKKNTKYTEPSIQNLDDCLKFKLNKHLKQTKYLDTISMQAIKTAPNFNHYKNLNPQKQI